MNKNIMIAVGAVVVLAGAGVFFLGQNKATTPAPTPTTVETTPVETVPTGVATDGAMKKDEGMMTKASVETKNFAFVPAMLTVKAGEKITFTNRDGAKHSVTSTDGTSFDTGLLGKDESATFTAPTKPGSYPFYCTLHPNMKGTLVVE